MLRHRLVLSYEALSDEVTADAVLRRVLAALPVPDVAAADALIGRPARPTGCCGAWSGRSSAASTGGCRARTARVFRGAGIDFADLRAYTPEDDVRHIDWNVTARLDEPYVRQYTEDRELTAWLVLDRSRLDARSAPPERGKDVGADRAGGHAWPGCSPRAATGSARSCTTTALQRVIPPRTGRTHVLRLTHELTKPRPARRGPGTTTDLAAMLRLAASTIRRRSLVFVISDFIAETELGAAADPARAPPRGGRGAAWSTRWSSSCPTSG